MEVINPATMAPCAEGETGVLVLTDLTREDMPLHPLLDRGHGDPGHRALRLRTDAGPLAGRGAGPAGRAGHDPGRQVLPGSGGAGALQLRQPGGRVPDRAGAGSGDLAGPLHGSRWRRRRARPPSPALEERISRRLSDELAVDIVGPDPALRGAGAVAPPGADRRPPVPRRGDCDTRPGSWGAVEQGLGRHRVAKEVAQGERGASGRRGRGHRVRRGEGPRRGLADRAQGLHHQHHRAQRRGQDQPVQLHLGASTARSGADSLRRARTSPGCRRTGARELGIARTFQNIACSRT